MAEEPTREAFERRIIATFDDVAEQGQAATSYETVVEQRDRLNDVWHEVEATSYLDKEALDRLQRSFAYASKLLERRFRHLAVALPPEDNATVIEEGAPTIDNFFYARHRDQSQEVSGEALETALASTEARLGVVLPELLKALYRRQNGGHTDFRLAASVDNPRHEFIGRDKVDDAYDAWETVVPNGTLRPLEDLAVLGEALDAGDFSDDGHAQRTRFPNAERMIVIAGTWDLWLCLDYGEERSVPAVVLFDEVRWMKLGDTFAYQAADFDAFFAALRREAVTMRYGQRVRGGRALAKSE